MKKERIQNAMEKRCLRKERAQKSPSPGQQLHPCPHCSRLFRAQIGLRSHAHLHSWRRWMMSGTLEMFSNLYFTPRELGEGGEQFVAHYWSGPINRPHPRWQSVLCGNFITAWSGTTWVTTSIVSALEWAYPHTFTSYTHPETSRRHNSKLSSTSQFCFLLFPVATAGGGYQWCCSEDSPIFWLAHVHTHSNLVKTLVNVISR